MSSDFSLDIPKVIKLSKADVFVGKEVVLSNINFDLAEAEFVYLTGKSGSGKTSLIKSLYKAAPITGEQVSVLGHNINELKPNQVSKFRRKLGIVFQEFHLINEWGVTENLEFVLKATGWTSEKEIKQRIEEVLYSVNLIKTIHKKVYELSGGQQQKLCLARAVLNLPALLLADEPTGNLDEETTVEMVEVIKKLSIKNKMAVLMATHDTGLIEKYPARTVVCKEGRVV